MKKIIKTQHPGKDPIPLFLHPLCEHFGMMFTWSVEIKTDTIEGVDILKKEKFCTTLHPLKNLPLTFELNSITNCTLVQIDFISINKPELMWLNTARDCDRVKAEILKCFPIGYVIPQDLIDKLIDFRESLRQWREFYSL